MPLADYIDLFPRQRVLVVGDVILDHYVRGSVSRTSPEAPVPILAMEEEEWLPGGAANVARNITSLGAGAVLVGLVGDDEPAARLRELLARDPLLKAALIVDKSRPTTLKTRFVAQGQQMLRLDREVRGNLSDAAVKSTQAQIARLLDKVGGVILSDYGKGMLRPDLIQWLVGECRRHGIRVLVDPKGRDYTRYRGVTVLTPNRREASEATGVAVSDLASLSEAARALHRIVQCEAVVITRSEEGISVFPRRGKPSHLPARCAEVFDVTGAGDTVIATLGLAMIAGASFPEAAELGNLAAGIVVGRAGVATVSADALRLVCEGDTGSPRRKLVTDTELQQIARSLRQSGRRIVFTNGFFDLLHHGHVRLLNEARKMGDALVVAINSDASTRRLKGEGRPILKANERVDLLGALPSVDYLVLFDEDTPVRLLELVRPHVLVKGGRTGAGTPQEVVGAELVKGWGGEVRLVTLDNEPRISSILERAALGKPAKTPARPPRKKRP